jgi:hypothetical protein
VSLIEVRVSARTGKTTDVNESFDLMSEQNLIELLGRTG